MARPLTRHLTAAEADAALSRESLDVDDPRQRERVAPVLGLDLERAVTWPSRAPARARRRSRSRRMRSSPGLLEADLDPDSPLGLSHSPPAPRAPRAWRVGMDECDLEPEQPVGEAPRRSARRPARPGPRARRGGRSPRTRRGACRGRDWRGTCRPASRPPAREELDPALADAHRGRLDTLGGDRVAMLQLGAEDALVRLDGLVESSTATPRW